MPLTAEERQRLQARLGSQSSSAAVEDEPLDLQPVAQSEEPLDLQPVSSSTAAVNALPVSTQPNIRDILPSAAIDSLLSLSAPFNPITGPIQAMRGLSRIPEPAVMPVLATGGGMAGQATGLPFGATVGSGLGAAGAEIELARRKMAEGVAPIPRELLGRMGTSGAITGGLTLAAAGIPASFRFLTGNKAKIRLGQKALEESANKLVQSTRQGGQLHAPILNMLENESATAWAPMKQVASAIQGEIPSSEVKTAIAARLANSPDRIGAATAILDDLLGDAKAIDAVRLTNLPAEVGKSMSRNGIKGLAARTAQDQLRQDIRNGIADVINARAPEEMKGNVYKAWQQWADYATDRNSLFEYFKVGASPRFPTDKGISLISKAAKERLDNTLNLLSPTERGLLERLQGKSGVDLIRPVLREARKLQVAQRFGSAGKAAAKVAPYVGGAAITAALAKVMGKK